MHIDHSVKPDDSWTKLPTKPTNGCDLNVSLSFAPDEHAVQARVEGKTNQGGPIPAYQKREVVSSSFGIHIAAKGGRGLPGAYGMPGQKGADGYHGRDASQGIRGTDGGPGQNGSDGKPGSKGGTGGDGGNVTIRINEQDTDILALTSVDVSGGDGGSPGKHGVGGAGGKGGKGGSGYCWTTRTLIPITTYRYESSLKPVYTVEGTVYKTVSEDVPYTHYETKVEEHFTGGGRDGKDGAPGKTPTWLIPPGDQGKNGLLTIEVISGGKTETFSEPYRLVATGFQVIPSTENGILEPGDTFAVANIKVTNNGLMPSPRGKKFTISLRRNSWSVSASNELYLLDSIAPGETVTIPGKLHFSIPEYSGKNSAAYEANEVLELAAHSIRLRGEVKSFSGVPNLKNKPTFKISHPIELDNVMAPITLLPNEIGTISFFIKNNSTKKIGPAATDPRLRRDIKIKIQMREEDGSDSNIIFCDRDGRPIQQSALIIPASDVDPQQSKKVDAYIRTGQRQPISRSIILMSELYLEKYESKGEFKRIQTIERRVKEGDVYQLRPTDDFLLVMDSKTTSAALTAWKECAESLGLSYGIWDLSVQGQLDLSKATPSSPKGNLHSYLRNKLMVIVNDETYQVSQGERATPSVLISQVDLDIALRDNNSKVYLFGRSWESERRPIIAPWTPRKESLNFQSVEDFAKASRGGSLAYDKEYVIPIRHSIGFFSNRSHESYFAAEFEKIRQIVLERWPAEQISVDRHFEDSKAGKPFTKEVIGLITLKRRPVAEDPDLFGLEVPPSRRYDPEVIKSLDNKIMLLTAMSRHQLVHHALKVFLNRASSPELMICVNQALLHKLATEAVEMNGCTSRNTFKGLPTLDVMTQALIAQTNRYAPPFVNNLASFIGNIDFFNTLFGPWYRSYLPWDKKGWVKSSMRENVKKIDAHLASILPPQDYNSFTSRRTQHLADLKQSKGSMVFSSFLPVNVKLHTLTEPQSTKAWRFNPYLFQPRDIIWPYYSHQQAVQSLATERAERRKTMVHQHKQQLEN